MTRARGLLLWALLAAGWCHSHRVLNAGRRLLGIQPLKASDTTYGQNNFGDLMVKSGLETSVVIDGSYEPLERVVLTANGNLQRIMSAYYGSSVVVDVLKCDKIGEREYDREVDLLVGGQKFCNAKGAIRLLDDDCVEAVESKAVGVGQLFRYLGLLPSFTLVDAGHTDKGELWRTYTLSNAKLECRFTETFVLGFDRLR